MIKCAITGISSIAEYVGAMPDALRSELSGHLPKLAVRKFSDSGLQMASVLRELGTSEDEPVISASTFAESRSLEEFIDSFPAPSPARFQRSVHPSAVQQARVVVNAPLRTYIPIAGQEGIAIVAVRTALSLGEGVMHLVGGEECGTWSVGIKAGSGTGFAFGLKLEPVGTKSDTLGTISWTPDASGNASSDASLLTLHRAICGRRAYAATHPDMGTIAIEWR
jgi:hypothetical protein